MGVVIRMWVWLECISVISGSGLDPGGGFRGFEPPLFSHMLIILKINVASIIQQIYMCIQPQHQ